MARAVAVGLLVFLAGCASTTIDTPLGRYTSTRDAQLDDLMIVIERYADGSERTEVILGGARGDASPVINGQADSLRVLFEAAFQSGFRAASPTR